MKGEHSSFYRDVIDALQSNTLAVFAGAGLSKSAGFVDWKGLLRDIATDLGLDIDKESDLISIAQFNVNKVGGRSMLNKKIIDEFNEDVSLTENHKILARLPINTYWTTNYDDLIERSLKGAKRIGDAKHSINQLNFSIPRRDAVIYKMHGDKTLPNEAVITKDDYERYFSEKIPFINTLSGDLVSKLFIFIGFSFNDPNLDYVLSRVRLQMHNAQRHHWFFVKRIKEDDPGIKTHDEYIYQTAKQDHFINDLRRFKLLPVYVDTYTEITEILQEIESIFKKKTVFISGSAEEYGALGAQEAKNFIHILSARLIKEGYRIVNGFGWGIGSAIINGALEEIYKRPDKYSQDLLIMKPFPQFATGEKTLEELWAEYRLEMLSYAGIAIYIFGNKLNPKNSEREIILADGVGKEFEIAEKLGIIQIPVKGTGYIAGELADDLRTKNFGLDENNPVAKSFEKLYNSQAPEDILESIIYILNQLKK